VGEYIHRIQAKNWKTSWLLQSKLQFVYRIPFHSIPVLESKCKTVFVEVAVSLKSIWLWGYFSEEFNLLSFCLGPKHQVFVYGDVWAWICTYEKNKLEYFFGIL
jgi:hypothetical protein